MSQSDSFLHEPLSLAPADPGWRAVLLHGDAVVGLPVLAWGVYRSPEKDAAGRPTGTFRNWIEAVVHSPDAAGRGFLLCAQDLGRAYYVGPTEPMPTDAAQVRDRLESLAAHDRSGS